MKNSKNDFNNAGQSVTEVKKSQKHDANLQKNSSLYFQIGLILCLLGTYSLFEMQFRENKISIPKEIAQAETLSIDYVEPFTVEIVEQKKPEPLPSVDIIDVIKVVDDKTPDIKTIVKTPNEPKTSDKPVADVGDIPEIDIVEEVFVPFTRIEKVPVYPGCEKLTDNERRKKCMSEKISKLINKKFNSGLASQYGLSGKQRISTQFTIDKTGNVIDVKIRAPHPALEKEANRVIHKIPEMEPGLQRNVPVGVIYTLPIVFEVRD